MVHDYKKTDIEPKNLTCTKTRKWHVASRKKTVNIKNWKNVEWTRTEGTNGLFWLFGLVYKVRNRFSFRITKEE